MNLKVVQQVSDSSVASMIGNQSSHVERFHDKEAKSQSYRHLTRLVTLLILQDSAS